MDQASATTAPSRSSSAIGLNVAAQLVARAEQQPHGLAVVYPEGRNRQGRVRYIHYTFRQLHESSDELARGLAAIGIRRGVRTVMMVKPSLEFFALTFALFKVGAIPVLVDPGMGVRNLGQCLAEAEPEAFVGIPKAHLARVLFGWGRRTLRTLVTVGPRRFWGGYTLDQVRSLGQGSDPPLARLAPDDPAAILFTSGSTGVPKGAVYTHGIFTAQVEVLRQSYGIQPGEIDLCTFPLFALFAPALGMTAIVPDMDATRPAQVNPLRIREAIEDFGVTNMFGSPALLNRVGQYGQQHGWRLPTLRRVISAGAPVPAAVVERFVRMLAPGVQVLTPYGATEALPVCSIGSREILDETRALTARGAGVCVGRPVEGMEVCIIRITDEPISTWSEDLLLPTGSIGEIAVKGPVATRAYWNRPESNALAKIVDPRDGGFFHRMGDVGYRDERGRIWFCGRKSHRVRTPGGTLFTIPCEAIFNEHPHVFRTALVGVGPAGAQRPVLCVELERQLRGIDRETLKQELLMLGSQHDHTREIRAILFHSAFPVDIRHNSKIFREQLAVWASRQKA